MIFYARATRGRGSPSLGLMARLGVPVGRAGEKVARSGRSISPHPWRENEQAWKGSGETAGMVSVLAEPPR